MKKKSLANYYTQIFIIKIRKDVPKMCIKYIRGISLEIKIIK